MPDHIPRPATSSPATVRSDAPALIDGGGAPTRLYTPGLARHELLTARAEQLARGSRAEATWRTYDAKWRRFQAWCAEHDEDPLPAGPLTVARFLTDLAPEWRPATPTDPSRLVVEGQVLVTEGLRPSTIEVFRAAISVAHQSADLPNPCEHPAVRRVLAGIRRHRGLTPPRRRAALRPADMHTVLAAMRPDEHLADARDTALLLIGWKAALRTDDLHRLDVADLVVEDGDGGGLAVRLRRSKTDQAGQSVTVGITATEDPGDPLDAVAAWARWHNRLRAHGVSVGPAWRGVDRYGRRPRVPPG